MSRWDEALWGEDRWAVLSIADLLRQPPPTDRGFLIGVGDWRFVVEVLLPIEPLSLWGFGEWNEAEWNTYTWADLSPWMRGMQWGRGDDQYLGRPRVGEATLTLDNSDGLWSPWNPSPAIGGPSFFAPGTVVRAGCRSASDPRAGGWLPQVCFLVDDWSESYAGAGADTWIDVTGFETLSDLSGINDNALPGLVGGGEGADARITRLLEAADWKYGLDVESPTIAAGRLMRSTDMAANRLAECYITADSSSFVFRSSRTGAAFLAETIAFDDPALRPLIYFSVGSDGYPAVVFHHDGGYVYPTPSVVTVPYNADSTVTKTDAEHIINEARFARVGGSQIVFLHTASRARYGLRTLPRSDLMCDSDFDVETIAMGYVNTRARSTLRCESLEVATSDRGDAAYLAMIAADIGDQCHFLPESSQTLDDPRVFGWIGSLSHRVTPRSAGAVTWSTTVGISTYSVQNVPAALLPQEFLT